MIKHKANPTIMPARKKVTQEKKTKTLSPYIKFCKKERPKIVKGDPEMTFADIGRELGKRWREKTKAEKAQYE